METVTPVARLNRDLLTAERTLSDDEARFLVDAYYILQENRKRSDNQVRSMGEEPHEILGFFASQFHSLEGQVKTTLDYYTDTHKVGAWMKSIHGIGPVIAAGLLAHIDITKTPTVGHIWRFAGLDPTSKWKKGQKRPWNARLKTLCWHAGESFVKNSGSEKDIYGAAYRIRKEYELARNDSGANAVIAAETLKRFKIGQNETRKHLEAGHLPPAQIHSRSKRWAVKLFLSHLHTVWYWIEYGTLPPLPYAIAQLGHAHLKFPPKLEIVPGLSEALVAWDRHR